MADNPEDDFLASSTADPSMTLGEAAYATGAIGSSFAPGAGVADVMGYAPDPFNPGQMLPSFSENVAQGNYLDAGIQTLGLAGDAFYAAAPFTMGVAALPGAGLKTLQAGAKTLRGARSAADLPKPKDFEFYQDNPAVSRPDSGKEWLESNIRFTEERYADTEPSMLRGPITANLGSRNTDMFLSTDELTQLPGAMGEARGPGDPNFDRLLEQIKTEGFDPDQAGNKVVVGVNHKGEAYLMEGNTRAAVAKELGIPNIKTEVRYWNGGEMIDGPYKPEAVAARASDAPRPTAQSSTLYRSEATSYENPNEGAVFYTPDKSYAELYASEDRVLRQTSLPADVFDIREPGNSEAVLNWVDQKISNLEDISGVSVDIRDVYAGIEQGGPQGASRALAAYNNILAKQADRSIIPGQAEKMFMQDFGVDAMTIKEAGRDLDEYSVAFKDVPVNKAEGGVITLADVARNTGRGPRGVDSLAPIARNMYKTMVS